MARSRFYQHSRHLMAGVFSAVAMLGLAGCGGGAGNKDNATNNTPPAKTTTTTTTNTPTSTGTSGMMGNGGVNGVTSNGSSVGTMASGLYADARGRLHNSSGQYAKVPTGFKQDHNGRWHDARGHYVPTHNSNSSVPPGATLHGAMQHVGGTMGHPIAGFMNRH